MPRLPAFLAVSSVSDSSGMTEAPTVLSCKLRDVRQLGCSHTATRRDSQEGMQVSETPRRPWVQVWGGGDEGPAGCRARPGGRTPGTRVCGLVK